MKTITLGLLLSFFAVRSQATIYLGTYQGELLAIDDSTYAVTKHIKLKSGIPREMVLMPDKKRILLMTNQYSGLEIVDLEKGEVVESWNMDTPTTRLRPTSMAVDPTGRYVYTMSAKYTKTIDRWEIEDEKLSVIVLTTHKVFRQ